LKILSQSTEETTSNLAVFQFLYSARLVESYDSSYFTKSGENYLRHTSANAFWMILKHFLKLIAINSIDTWQALSWKNESV
jgi:hypothetical protein